jgi:hypothetical protein
MTDSDGVRLIGAEGFGVDLQVTGYQFPDAVDPGQRFSWHMVEGEGVARQGRWRFRYAALTCDEIPRISAWLREWAISDAQFSLSFMEPNLRFKVVDSSLDNVTLGIEFDLEFSPPWQQHSYAGDPFVLTVPVARRALATAADAWDQEWAPFPDKSRA